LDSGVSKPYSSAPRRLRAHAHAGLQHRTLHLLRRCDFTSIRNVTFHPHGAKGSENRGAEVAAWASGVMPSGTDWPTRNGPASSPEDARNRRDRARHRKRRLLRPTTPMRARSDRADQGNAEEWLDPTVTACSRRRP
jgi:hypothetical protein